MQGKYKLFAVSLTGLMIGGGLFMILNNKSTDPHTLRVAFPYAKPSSAYEPAKIHLAPEYVFLENIYSPLVELSPKSGTVEPGVAESFRWDGNELHLVIRSDLKTISGQSITAKDAEFSLKRLLTMPGNTHGDFKELICGNASLESIEASCDGIRVDKNELILKTSSAGKTFLLPMLAAIDFAIIPKSSVDLKTLVIADFKNTSGPYYVSKDDPNGEIELRANPSHYHYSALIPHIIRLVPNNTTNPRGSFEDFKNGKIDYITTIDKARADDVISFSRTESDSVLHTTMNVRSFILTFTERGLKELSKSERFAIGNKIRESFWNKFAGNDGYEKSRQFFPAFGEGTISDELIQNIEKKMTDSTTLPNKHLKMALVRLGDISKFEEAVKTSVPDIEIYESPKNPNFMKFDSISDMPHMLISGPDTGFLEDIGLFSYSLNAGYFGLNKSERTTWLKKYMATPEKADRMELLKSLHGFTLSEPVIIPLLVAPYAALVRKPWKIGLSQLYANNPLWLIQKD